MCSVVMKRAKSNYLVLSNVLTQTLPRTLLYDNSCNMAASAMLRVAWLLKKTRIVFDRFHSKCHTCSKYFDADGYLGLATHRSSSSESFNTGISKATHHMRYLKGTKLIPFLPIRFDLLNLAAHFKSKFDQIPDPRPLYRLYR